MGQEVSEMGAKKCPNENDDRNDDYKSGHHHGQSPCQHHLNEKLRQTCLILGVALRYGAQAMKL